MDSCDLVAIKIDISELAPKYAYFVDRRDWETILSLFTPDAVFDASKVYDKVWTGPAELREFFYNAPHAVAHHPAGHFTEVEDDTHALTKIKFLIVWHRQIISVDYIWELLKADGVWRIRKQTIEVVGRARWAEPSAAR